MKEDVVNVIHENIITLLSISPLSPPLSLFFFLCFSLSLSLSVPIFCPPFISRFLPSTALTIILFLNHHFTMFSCHFHDVSLLPPAFPCTVCPCYCSSMWVLYVEWMFWCLDVLTSAHTVLAIIYKPPFYYVFMLFSRCFPTCLPLHQVPLLLYLQVCIVWRMNVLMLGCVN